MATVGIRGNVRPRSGAAAAGNAIPADTPTFADLAFADLTGAHPAVRPPQATGPAAQAEPPVHGSYQRFHGVVAPRPGVPAAAPLTTLF